MTNGFHTETTTVAECLPVYMHPDLKRLVGEQADRQNIPMSEYVVRVLAKEVRRSDLAVVPRKRSGRPRKSPAPLHNGKKNGKRIVA